jgi:hypothetical protein
MINDNLNNIDFNYWLIMFIDLLIVIELIVIDVI